MRIYRPQATKPIPPDAQIDRKRGVVTYRVGGKSRKAVLTENGERMRVECGTWRIEFRDHLSRKQHLVAFSHEGQSRFLASAIEKLIAYHGQALPNELKDYAEKLPSRIISALQECGLLESEQTPLSKPLSELLALYEQTLCARERSGKHVYESVSLPKEVFEACGFSFWREIKDEKVQGYLKDLREGHTLRKAAKGKEAKPRRVGYRRSNAYLVACQAFANWVVEDRKWARESPLRGMKKLDAKQDPRHTRRAITVEESRLLLATTATGPERYGMTGWERCLLYWLAALTGLRAGEIRRLRVADFDLAGEAVTVRAAKATKNKQTRQQPLNAKFCAAVREFFGTREPSEKAFGASGSWTELTDKTADVLKEDLSEAGIAYQNEQGDCFDFHSLRGECASLLIESGADIKQTQEVLRHSTAALTLGVYTRLTAHSRKAQAVAALPDLSLPESQSQVLAKTGTDDRDVTRESLRKVYAADGQDRTKPDSIGQVTRDGASKTQFPMQNEGCEGTVDPKVEGSRPFGLAE